MRKTVLILVMFVISATFCYGEVFLKISKSGSGKINCAVPQFYYNQSTGDSLSGKNLEKDLKRDLDISGYFFTGLPPQEVNRLRAAEKRLSSIQPGVWKKAGADIVVKMNVDVLPDMLKAQLHVYNAADGRGVFGKKYKVGKDDYRTLIHAIANDIIYNSTGEKGFCDAKLVFISDLSGSKEVYFSDFDGRRRVRVTKDNSIIVSPFWSPSGKQLVYSSYRYGSPRIILHDISTGKRRFLAKFPGLNTCGPFSPDGESLLMLLSRDGNPEVYRFDLENLMPVRLTRSKASEASPCWSPDGKRIAYVSDVSGRPQVYVMDRYGNNKKRVTYEGYYNSDPDWSPTGDKIAYCSKKSRQSTIFVVHLNNGEVIELDTGPGKAEDPTWAPDGRHIVYSYNSNGKYNLYIIDTETGEKQLIGSSETNEVTPAFTR